MFKTRSMGAAVLALVLSAVALPSLATRSAIPMLELGRQQIVTMDGHPLAIENVRKAILYGGITRRWTAVGDQPGVLTLQANNGKHLVVVDVAYDESSYEIRYKSSVEMDFENKDGRNVIHPKYNQWVNDLSTAIRDAVRTRNGERY